MKKFFNEEEKFIDHNSQNTLPPSKDIDSPYFNAGMFINSVMQELNYENDGGVCVGLVMMAIRAFFSQGVIGKFC